MQLKAGLQKNVVKIVMYRKKRLADRSNRQNKPTEKGKEVKQR